MTTSPLIKTRVLKVHVQAALNILDDGMFQMIGDSRKLELATQFAEAILSATDKMTRYCVIVTEAPRTVYTYGPYATYQAALKAAESGALGTQKGATGYVLPLIPAPKIPKKKRVSE